MINDIAYAYDRYLKSVGADVAEEKDQVIDKYFTYYFLQLYSLRVLLIQFH